MYSPNYAGDLSSCQDVKNNAVKKEPQNKNNASSSTNNATTNIFKLPPIGGGMQWSTNSIVVSTTTATTVPTKKKGASPSVVWSKHILSQALGEFAVEVLFDDAFILYRWNGTFWKEYTNGEGASEVAAWLEATYEEKASDGLAESVWKFGVKRLRKKCPKPEIKDTDEIIIPLNNAYVRVNVDASIDVIQPNKLLGYTHAVQVNIKTPIGQKHTPEKMPTDSLFYKFLSSSLPDEEVRDFIQEQCAATFMRDNYGLAFWWFGVANAGKSMLRALLELFHYKSATIGLHKLDDDFGLEHIVGASLLQVDEVESKKWCEATFKSLITGDPVSVNRKHKPAIPSYRNRASLVVTSNRNPFVTDNSDGVYRRLCPVFWGVTIKKDDVITNIHRKIFEQEGDIFLDWILDGIQRLARRGRFLPENHWPEKVLETKKTIRHSNDHIGAWLSECDVKHSPINAVPKSSIYEHFKKWSLDAGRTVLDPNVFWRELACRDGFHEVNKRVQQRINGERTSVVFVEIGEDIRENAMEKLGLYDYDDLEVNNGQ